MKHNANSHLNLQPRYLWKLVMYVAIPLATCALVAIDLCLDFGGARSCKSTFEYPEFIATIALLGLIFLGHVLVLLVIAASTASIAWLFSILFGRKGR